MKLSAFVAIAAVIGGSFFSSVPAVAESTRNKGLEFEIPTDAQVLEKENGNFYISLSEKDITSTFSETAKKNMGLIGRCPAGLMHVTQKVRSGFLGLGSKTKDLGCMTRDEYNTALIRATAENSQRAAQSSAAAALRSTTNQFQYGSSRKTCYGTSTNYGGATSLINASCY